MRVSIGWSEISAPLAAVAFPFTVSSLVGRTLDFAVKQRRHVKEFV